jgi:hypothetical protein
MTESEIKPMDKTIWPITLTHDEYHLICAKLRKQEPLTNTELITVESIRMAYNAFGLEEALGKLEENKED